MAKLMLAINRRDAKVLEHSRTTNHNKHEVFVMAEDSLTERSNPFNQLSPSSCSDAAFQSSERLAKLELMTSLLAQAEALSSIALNDAFCESSPSQRHHYLAALNELIVAVSEQLEDVLASINPDKQE